MPRPKEVQGGDEILLAKTTPLKRADKNAPNLRDRFFSFFLIYISSWIFENVIAKWTFCVQQFSSAKNYLQSSH